ncbi:hypothetical protein [Pseudomonas serbica]|uniref:hypothetical protein n=1 Tax=Pseudomonas serbica TaxID=2965074 RepID=UPI00237A5958|nr:hypothetical protein [Pseudomonas serbica]
MAGQRAFSAPTMSEAMAQAKEAFGDDFLFYGKDKVPGGVKITVGPALVAPALVEPPAEELQLTGFRRALARSEQLTENMEIPLPPASLPAGPATAYRKAKGGAAYATQASEKPEGPTRSEAAAPQWSTSPVTQAPPVKQATAQEIHEVFELLEAEPVEDEIPKKAQLDANQRFLEDLKQVEAISNWSKHLLDEMQNMQDIIRRRLLPSVAQGSAYADLHNLLIQAGFKPASCDAVLKHLPSEVAERRLEPMAMSRWIEQALVSHMRVMNTQDIWSDQRVVVPVLGSSGSGKSVAVAKLAARYSLRYQGADMQIISLDPDNSDTLKGQAEVLGVPFKVLQEYQDLGAELEKLQHKQVVLIDTKGYGYRSKKLPIQLARLNQPEQPMKPLLIMNANSESDLLDQTTLTYQQLAREAGVSIEHCAISKLDDTVRIGGLLSVIEQHNLTICYQSYSSDILDDFDRGNAMVLARQAFESAAMGWTTTPIQGYNAQQGRKFDEHRDQLMNNVHEMSHVMNAIRREFKSAGIVTRQAEVSGLVESNKQPQYALQIAQPAQAPAKPSLLWFHNNYPVESVFYRGATGQADMAKAETRSSQRIELVD